MVGKAIEVGDAVDAGDCRLDGEIEEGRRGTRGQ